MQAAEALAGRVQRLIATRVIAGIEGEALRTAIDRVYSAIKEIENEAVLRERRMAKGAQA
jgi:hypothetical protein